MLVSKLIKPHLESEGFYFILVALQHVEPVQDKSRKATAKG